MSKKRHKAKKRDRRSRTRYMSALEGGGLPVLLPGTPPSPEMLDEMTGSYQQKIRESPLWDVLVRELGEEEAERVLKEFRVEMR